MPRKEVGDVPSRAEADKVGERHGGVSYLGLRFGKTLRVLCCLNTSTALFICFTRQPAVCTFEAVLYYVYYICIYYIYILIRDPVFILVCSFVSGLLWLYKDVVFSVSGRNISIQCLRK